MRRPECMSAGALVRSASNLHASILPPAGPLERRHLARRARATATPPPPITTTAATVPSTTLRVVLSFDDSALDPAAEVPPVEPFAEACDGVDAKEEGADGDEGKEDVEDVADLASRSPPFSVASGSTSAGPGAVVGVRQNHARTNGTIAKVLARFVLRPATAGGVEQSTGDLIHRPVRVG